MTKESKCLGILGGLGPMSSAYFYEMITEHTKALTDQQHIDIILSSKSTTPDRTDYILGKSENDPSIVMGQEIEKLCTYGADVIAIPCNTAHYFHEMLEQSSRVPILNMIQETVQVCKNKGAKRIGVLATRGTISASIYENECIKQGIDYFAPSEEMQQYVDAIIYEQIKAGNRAERYMFDALKDHLIANGCEFAILGCTELSVSKKQLMLDDFYVDSLEALALKAITFCNKTPIGFGNLLK